MSITNRDEQVDYLVNQLSNLSPLISDYEKLLYRESILQCYSTMPVTSLAISEEINSIIKVRSNLSYLRSRLTDLRGEISRPFSSTYDKLFVTGTNRGLPSKQAIESDMFTYNPSLVISRNTIEDFDKVLEVIQDLDKLLDKLSYNLDNRRKDIS